MEGGMAIENLNPHLEPVRVTRLYTGSAVRLLRLWVLGNPGPACKKAEMFTSLYPKLSGAFNLDHMQL